MSEPKYLFALLLGALAFNVSGHSGGLGAVTVKSKSTATVAITTTTTPEIAGTVGSATLLSHDGRGASDRLARTPSSFKECDLDEVHSDDSSGHCEVAEGDVRGRARLEKKQIRKIDPNDPTRQSIITSEQWFVSTEMETECTEGCENGRRTSQAKSPIADLRKASEVAQKLLAEQAKALRSEKDEARKKAARRERCEVDASFNEYKKDSEVAECKIDKLNAMTDQKEAATYFDKEIQPRLQAMVGCDAVGATGMMTSMVPTFLQTPGAQSSEAECTEKRAEGAKLIDKIAAAHGSNLYLRESLTDLGKFAWYNDQVQQLNQYALLQPNDPRRQQAAQQLSTLKQHWAQYASSRRDTLKYLDRHAIGWESFSVGTNLGADLNGYDATARLIAEQHARLLGQTGQTGATQSQVQNGRPSATTPYPQGEPGRLQRGALSSAYGGGPGAAPINPQSMNALTNGVSGASGVAGRPVTSTNGLPQQQQLQPFNRGLQQPSPLAPRGAVAPGPGHGPGSVQTFGPALNNSTIRRPLLGQPAGR